MLCPGDCRATVLELQHSSISEEERGAGGFLSSSARATRTAAPCSKYIICLGKSSPEYNVGGHAYSVMQLRDRKQFVENWKRATACVFFDWRGHNLCIENGLINYLEKTLKRHPMTDRWRSNACRNYTGQPCLKGGHDNSNQKPR